ncbi:Ion transport protein-domain-containing protein [Phanerochaete sordida]|uniref:Calcium-channel protein CCH1 n=1 Tax=Phanerochaete sordida TaxID=48140 RepID=A0A9P3LHG7_9APHY|nr:Ion transport protein-domain-containing protein [Phanerochaete sordida]
MERHQHSLSGESTASTSSAIDLTGTPAGIGSSVPPSPALVPEDTRESFARRRLSWGRMETTQDPLRFDLPNPDPRPSTSQRTGPATAPAGWAAHDDPFFSPTEEDSSAFGHNYTYQSAGGGTYSTAQPGPSSASLISSAYRTSDPEVSPDDDEIGLTANMPRPGSGWGQRDTDPELSASTTRSKRTVRYSTSPSPLRKAGDRLTTISRTLRRASLRVVNMAGLGIDEHVRLADVDEKFVEKEAVDEDEDDPEKEYEPVTLDLSRSLPIRGRTLGFMGPTNSVRLAMYRFLVHPWTEPTILLLIIVHAILLTIQAAPNIALSEDLQPDDNGYVLPPKVRGYFHAWEDYALFVLFIIFTLEMFARIAVSGFLLDPEVPTSALFTSIFISPPDPMLPPSASDPVTLSRHPSLVHSHSQPHMLSRNSSVTERLRRFRYNLSRPFALAHHSMVVSVPPTSTETTPKRSSASRARSDTVQSKTPMMEKAARIHSHMRNPSQPTFLSKALKSDNSGDTLSLPFRFSVQKSQDTTQRNLPYLRHSWTRIDFLAVISFWICFALAVTGAERGSYHIGIFRALSVLRTTRLLAITSGTTTIMHSLKTARPLLASVAYFVLFAMIMFSIIGIQSFRGSFRRTCHLLPTAGEGDIDLGNQCGAHMDPNTLEIVPYIPADNNTQVTVKGFVCPLGQVCLENPGNPFSGVESFDTVYYSALQVFIVSSANGWSPLMYSMMDSEFFISCFFFIVCVIILNFWLINLFVAVITNTFTAIRKDTNKSAFGAAPLGPALHDDEGWSTADGRRIARHSRLKEIYDNTRLAWVALALASLVLQATSNVDAGPTHKEILDKGELALTFVFDLEILIRFAVYLPDYRSFFARGQNWLDLVLAIGSSILQIPAVHNSSVYPWLTIFQLGRFYRVILEIPRMKPLLLAVFGNMYGLANMSLFLFMINYITALVAIQLLRGDVQEADDRFINWGDVFNSFLGVYQIFSSENWTNVLYDAATAEVPLRQSAVVVLFISGWFFFANYIVLQMFIAVINENFDVAEEQKRSRQASHFWAAQRPQKARAPWVRRMNPYRWFEAKPKAIAVDQLPSNLILPMQKSLVQDYALPFRDRRAGVQNSGGRSGGPKHVSKKSLNILQNLFSGEKSDDVPLTTLRSNRRDSVVAHDAIDEETERHLEVLAALNNETATVDDVNDILYERRAQKADFIRDHPTYDKTFWIFSQKNPLRRACQKLVAPANGERIFGTPPSPIAHPIFQLVLLLTVIAGIVVEWIATPPYRRQWYQDNGFIRGSWFDIAEAAFGLSLFVEFLIKIVADGFIFTPNAYIRSIWNVLDFMIMIGLVVNVATGLIFIGGLSRLTRSLKALRALRLITLIDKMRSTFESLIIFGATRIIDAALLAILYMIPYAVWGTNIFAGRMNECNDSGNNISSITDCINEYSNSVVQNSNGGDAFSFLVPRVWDNPQPSTKFSFDSFRASLLILFEIVSLEGWIDVMSIAVSIVGRDDQPQQNVSQANAIFFLIYNLLGGVVILTLFVSIIIGNFTSRTGSAFLTQPQREWIDLQKLIKRQRPSKRPKTRPTWPIRAWCYDRAVYKHGWWHRTMTALFVLHVIALMTQTFAPQHAFDDLRTDFFLGITIVYLIDIIVRLYGLGWSSYSANGWNLFDIIVAGGSLITIIVVRFNAGGFAVQQLQKLFVTSIAFKLVQRTNSLNKLFKTAVASLPVILSLLSLWMVLFLFFAILYVEVFSLTKWSTGESRNQNYSSMPKALVMLAFMTTGEGWNQYMHDYALVYPRCTNSSPTNADSDCGSVGWAFTLFIAWNLLSMYIFANLFTGVVVESFNYVFQMTGGSKEITREEMRSFKKVWAEFANPKTGYLERHKFVPFFSKLTGIFEVKIYPTEWNIKSIMARSQADGSSATYPVDVNRLQVNVNSIDRQMIKRRKNLWNRLYHEARISYEPGKGISFTNMLLLLAHHKLIVDQDALVLQDLVVRNETNKLVTDLVDFDRVQSLLLMISHRRRYLAMKEQARLQKFVQEGLPDIVVDAGEPVTPPSTTRDITSPGQHTSHYMGPDTPTPAYRGHSPELSLAFETPSGSVLQRSRRRVSDVSMLSIGDAGTRGSFDASSRDSRVVEEDAGNVLSSMQNSVWGDMLLEAAEEES